MLLLKPDIHTSRTGCLQIEFCRAVTAHFYARYGLWIFPCRSPLRIRFKPDLPVYRIKKEHLLLHALDGQLFFIQAALHAACRCRFFHSLCATKQKRHKISQTLSPDMPFMIAFIYFLYAKTCYVTYCLPP